MKRKAIRCLLILSFLTIFGLLFYVDTAYSQETIRNKTKIEELEDKVENLSQRYEQNKTFYEAVFHQQNVFVRWIIFILLGMLGFQGLFTFKISKDIIDKSVGKAKEDMIKTIEKTRGDLERDSKKAFAETKKELTEVSETMIRTVGSLAQVTCVDEGKYLLSIGKYANAIVRLERGMTFAKSSKEREVFLDLIARSLQKSDSAHYPENFRKRAKEKPEIYSGLEREIEEAIEGAV